MAHLDPDSVDRVVKLVLDAGDADSLEQAQDLLLTYRMQVLAGADACRDQSGQAALLTAVNTGVRALHGGVGVQLAQDSECKVPLMRGQRLSEVVTELGGHLIEHAGVHVPTIMLGAPSLPDDPAHSPRVWASGCGWIATVSPRAPGGGGRAAETPAAVLAASLAVSEIFQWFRGLAVAGDREISISLWDPSRDATGENAQGPPIALLPSSLWLLGLGHLGQAYGWLLGMLPYPLTAGTLVLHDGDRLSKANRATSMLYRAEQLGTPKARVVAGALERGGWQTQLIERRHLGGRLRESQDPLVLVGGVDNPDTRRSYDESGFPVIYDAGLGAGSDGYLGITVRRLPARKPSAEMWRQASARRGPLAPRAAAAYAALERSSGDRCGVEMLAGRTVATAFVGVSAACFVIGGLLRELHGGRPFELVDLTMRDPRRIEAIAAPRGGPARIGSVARAP